MLSVPASGSSAWSPCAAACSGMNYRGRRCSFFYTPTSVPGDDVVDCFLSDVDYDDITLTTKVIVKKKSQEQPLSKDLSVKYMYSIVKS